MESASCKIYVDIILCNHKDGSVQPLYVVWEDGRRYEIERILDVRPKASFKAGGAGIRYQCQIQGQIRDLYLEGDKWFVESK